MFARPNATPEGLQNGVSPKRQSLIKNQLHNYCTYLTKLSTEDLELLNGSKVFTVLEAVNKARVSFYKHLS